MSLLSLTHISKSYREPGSDAAVSVLAASGAGVGAVCAKVVDGTAALITAINKKEQTMLFSESKKGRQFHISSP